MGNSDCDREGMHQLTIGNSDNFREDTAGMDNMAQWVKVLAELGP